ncbi:glycoprotein-N-acetylgalactosamine 3-beta-galactosyltransferase 1-like [Amblyomma americanum]
MGLALSCYIPSLDSQKTEAILRRTATSFRGTPPLTPILYDLNNTAYAAAPPRGAVGLLRERVPLLCWLLTGPRTISSRARHVVSTWGRRCNRLLLMSSSRQGAAVELSVAEERKALWAKTKAALVELHAKHLTKYEWFLKADDDTYVIVENLRFFLLDKDPSQPLYFGYPFRVIVPGGYVSGGAGYVLSREALRRVVEQGLMQGRCRPDGSSPEDAELGRCLKNVGAIRVETRDVLGRNRFFPLAIEHFLAASALPRTWWIWRYSMYPVQTGKNCCSDTAVAFHYVRPQSMYLFEYLLYHAQVLGGPDERIHLRQQPPPPEL